MASPMQTGTKPGADVVARELARRIDSLVAWLQLAPLHKSGNVFMPLNPTRGDRNPGSFVIYGAGHAKAGGWVEYACPPAPGSRAPSLAGDALDLCAYIMTGNPRDRKTGYQTALRFLGWEGAGALDLPSQEAQRRALKRDRELAEKDAADELAANRKKAFERWLNDTRLDACVGGPVWTYLASRGINLHAFVAATPSRLPGAIRQRAEDFHRESGRKFTSMASLISGPDGKCWGVHRTFLKADGQNKTWGKADIEPQRKIWPSWIGGAIRLSKGQNACSPEEAARDGLTGEVLAIGEGAETMLSVAWACPKWRAWAAGTVGAIGNVIVPPSVSMVVLIGENDEGEQAQRAFERSKAEMARQAKAKGFELYITRPAAGDDDFNTSLQRLSEQLA